MIDLSEAATRRRTEGLAPPDASSDGLAALDARMLWSALTEPGDGVAGTLIAALGPREALEFALGDPAGLSPATLAPSGGQGLRAARERWRRRSGDAVHAADAARRAGVTPVTPEHPAWPAAVDDLGPHAPLCLWVRGSTPALSADRPALALVGARAATAYGEDVVTGLAADLGGGGVTIVSGGAYGIDGMAHRAALAAGAVTVAWLAGGVDRAYPSGHRGLLDAIVAAGGAVAAEVPCGSAPTKWRFLARNRLIAAASDATVVVEAGWRSGSLNTAGHAAALGRPLGAVPGPVTSAASAGCHRLLREYDAQCITSSDDARELLGWREQPGDGVPSTDPEVSRVGDALSTRSARSSSDIARRSGVDLDVVESTLGLLALEGAVRRGPDGWRAVPR